MGAMIAGSNLPAGPLEKSLGQLKHRRFGLLEPKSQVHIAPKLGGHGQIVTGPIGKK